MQRSIQKYGYKPDLGDFRDYYYKDIHSPMAMMLKGGVVAPLDPNSVHNIINTPEASTAIGVDGLPVSVSLRSKMPPVFNQGQLGSCTAQAAAALFQYVHGAVTGDEAYSRLQIYYDERLIEGSVAFDSGAQIRDAIQVLAKYGAGPEKDWPYVEANFAIEPPAKEVAEAAENKAIEYSRLSSRQDFRQCLVQGFPFIFGASIYSSFEDQQTAQTGIVKMPTYNDQLMGGHALCCVGYNSNYNGGDYYIVRNSWGDSWADGGYCYFPAAYLENPNLVMDAWTIRK